jgi:hypothetical protein
VDLGQGRKQKPVDDEERGYHTLFEVFHQLHCLVSLRQSKANDLLGVI